MAELGLIAREEALVWLKELSSDGLLIGQPGAGKTYLLYKFASQTQAWFVASDDLDQITADIRRLNPRILVVDDAHIDPTLIQRLIHIRNETKSKFKILACSWPGSKEELEAILGASKETSYYLDLLTRDQIVQVVKAAGIEEPIGLVREIVDQAEGRPALAVALTHLILKEGSRGLLRADTLVQSSFSFLEKKLVEEKSKPVVAAFSVGGRAGVKLEAVAAYLELSPLEVRGVVSSLASGGIIQQVDKEHLSVRPPALRQALIREVFYSGPASLKTDGLFELGSNPELTILELIGAKARGAEIDAAFLQSYVQKIDSPILWKNYGAIGESEAQWILDHYPEKLEYCWQEALYYIPSKVIPILLEKSIADTRALHSSPDQPMRVLQDWVKAGNPRNGQDAKRRDILFSVAKVWLDQGKDRKVGAEALTLACSPEYENNSLDPGSGNTITFTTGYISLATVDFVTKKWAEAKDLLCSLIPEHWQAFDHLVTDWALMSPNRSQLSEKGKNKLQELAKQMIADIEACVIGHAGLQLEINETRAFLGLSLLHQVDSEFSALFGSPPRTGRGEDFRAWQKKNNKTLLAIAEKWSAEPPELVLERILQLENEAALAGKHESFASSFCYQTLAKKVRDPKKWFELAENYRFKNRVVFNTLMGRLPKEDPLFWDQWSLENFDNPIYQGGIANIALHDEKVSDQLIERTLELVRKNPLFVDRMGFGVIPVETARKLLSNENNDVSTNAAINEWYSGEEKQPRDEIKAEWGDAVVRSKTDDYAIGQILQTNKELAFKWLDRKVADPTTELWEIDRVFSSALARLDRDYRKRLLQKIRISYSTEEMITLIVDLDPELYGELLSIERLADYRTAPFRRAPSEEWISLAISALGKGISIEDLAGTLIHQSFVSSRIGKESTMWEEEKSKFESLVKHVDPRIRAIGEIVIKNLDANRQKAISRERRENIIGYDNS